MAPLIINVSGSSTISRHPERAVVSVAVSANGTKQNEVTQGVTQTAKRLQADLNQLAPKDSKGQAAANAPITYWSMSTISTGSYFVYTQKDNNTDKETRYTANTSFEIKFADFDKLGAAVSNLAAMPYASINSISWQLTDKTKATLVGQSRKMAIEDAISQATDFALAAGKKHVVPVEINSDGSQAQKPYLANAFGASARAAYSLGRETEDSLKFAPEDVNLECYVQVKFEAW